MSDQMPSFPRPLPSLEGDAAPYWKAIHAGRVELPRCGACAKWIFYPRPFCPACLSRDIAWHEVPARGTVYTFAIVQKPTNPWFFGKTPYVYAVVELECGVRLPTMITGCDPEKITIGDPVEASFERVDDTVTLLHFRPRG